MGYYPITAQQASREILKINPGTLRTIHNIFGIDYNKPHAILRMEPPSTRAAIRKAATENGYPAAEAVVLIHRTGGRYYWKNSEEKRFYLFTLDAAGGLDNPKRSGYGGYYSDVVGDSVDDASKGDFDKFRRDPCEVYVILQNDEHKTEKSEYTKPNAATRYKLIDTEKNYGDVSAWIMQDRNSGEKARISRFFWYSGDKKRSEQLADVLDKSGYYIRDRRENLKKRAAALRAERAKTSYSAQDTAADVAEIENAATETRLYIADALRNATTITAGKIIEAIHSQCGSRYAFPNAAKRAQEARSHAYKDRETADKYKADALKELAKLRADVAAAIKPETVEEVKTA